MTIRAIHLLEQEGAGGLRIDLLSFALLVEGLVLALLMTYLLIILARWHIRRLRQVVYYLLSWW